MAETANNKHDGGMNLKLNIEEKKILYAFRVWKSWKHDTPVKMDYRPDSGYKGKTPDSVSGKKAGQRKC